MKLFFGLLGPLLAGFARYLVRRTDGPGWDLVNLETFQALKGRKFIPKWGVLDVFAHKVSIH